MRVPTYRFGTFELDPAARELRREGERVPLPPKSFDCLAYLIANRDRAVGRDELIAAVWGRVDITDTVVAQTMLRARKAIGDSGESSQRMVRTVPRFGYHWIAPVLEKTRGTVEIDASPVGQSAVPSPTTSDTPVAMRARGRVSAWRWTVATLGAIAIAATGVAFFASRSHRTPAPATLPDANALLVLPVRVASPESEDAWVRLGAMDYIASRLRHGGMRVVPTEQTLHLSEQLGATRSLDPDIAQRLQGIGDVRWVLAPEADHDIRGWRIRLTIFEGTREQLVEARGSTALAAATAAVDAWLRRVHPDRIRTDVGPTVFDQRLQQIDAELLAGQLEAARRLVASATPDERADPDMRVREGQIEFRAGRFDAAAALFERLLAEAQPSPEVRAKALMGRGAVEIRRGRPSRAQAYYARALEVALRGSPKEDPALSGNAYNGLGVALVQQGRMEEAVRAMGLARVAMQRSGNLIDAASVGANLGMIEQLRRHYPQALQEFDRAIAVFERFGVNDYMAAALMAKAAAQMDMVQPDAAAASIARAGSLMGSVNDRLLSMRIAATSANVALMRGRLREAARDIARLHALQVADDDVALCELEVRLRLAQGGNAEAAAIARSPVASTTMVPASLALASTQALLAVHDVAATTRWIAYRERMTVAQRGLDWDIASGLLAHYRLRRDDALALANTATERVEQAGSPAERVRAGLFKARLLRTLGQPEAAAPVLADLDAFAGSDYRVAWEMLALYRALHDPTMMSAALARVQALRGERDIEVVPAL